MRFKGFRLKNVVNLIIFVFLFTQAALEEVIATNCVTQYSGTLGLVSRDCRK